jgi:hypothetical protein
LRQDLLGAELLLIEDVIGKALQPRPKSDGIYVVRWRARSSEKRTISHGFATGTRYFGIPYVKPDGNSNSPLGWYRKNR